MPPAYARPAMADGLLVLLYAQQPAAISRLTVDHVRASDGVVRLRLGREPVAVPEPLATLVLHLVITPAGPRHHRDQGTSRWLLPGGRPGQPVSPYRISERLRQIGIHIDVAVAWQRASAGDWMTYAADVSRRTAKDNRP